MSAQGKNLGGVAPLNRAPKRYVFVLAFDAEQSQDLTGPTQRTGGGVR